jgi:hypothetical protein
MTKVQVVLYIIILGLVVNLLANMVWKYLPGSQKHIDKIATGALILICVLLVFFHKSGRTPERNHEQDVPTATASGTKEPTTGISIGSIEAKQGNITVEQVQGNKIVVHRDDAKDNQPPLFSKIEVGIPNGYIMTAVDSRDASKTFHVYAQPTSKVEGMPNEHSQDVVLSFDITNPNRLEMRIVKISVEVLDYQYVHILKTAPVASLGETRKYFCNVKGRAASYECRQLSEGYDFIKLSRGELEHFGVNVNTKTAGIYELGVSVEYSLGAETKRIVVGDLDRAVGFF